MSNLPENNDSPSRSPEGFHLSEEDVGRARRLWEEYSQEMLRSPQRFFASYEYTGNPIARRVEISREAREEVGERSAPFHDSQSGLRFSDDFCRSPVGRGSQNTVETTYDFGRRLIIRKWQEHGREHWEAREMPSTMNPFVGKLIELVQIPLEEITRRDRLRRAFTLADEAGREACEHLRLRRSDEAEAIYSNTFTTLNAARRVLVWMAEVLDSGYPAMDPHTAVDYSIREFRYFQEHIRSVLSRELGLGIQLDLQVTPHSVNRERLTNHINVAWYTTRLATDQIRMGAYQAPFLVQPAIGDRNCAFNAMSSHLRCAVNPDGPCEGCKHFEAKTS